jgi:hypothetical protein
MIINFNIFENSKQEPKVGDYYLIQLKLNTETVECKGEILEITHSFNIYKCIFLDKRNKLHLTPNWMIITRQQLIRPLKYDEIEEFELVRNANKYNLW